MIVDNEEYYEQEKPLSLKDIKSLITLLRQVMLWHGMPVLVRQVVESSEIEICSPRKGGIHSHIYSEKIKSFWLSNQDLNNDVY